MTGRADIDALAAEYVLGTLDAAERTALAARRQREPLVDAAISAWERRLAPLQQAVPAIAPPGGLFEKIERRIGANVVALPGASTVADLQRKIKRWRASALVATAAAASLLVTLGIREATRTAAPQNFVAVFQKDDASPSFVMSVDLATRTLSVRRVAADVPAGKTYQLWIASEKLGVGPQSLGLVEDQNLDVRRALLQSRPSL